MRKRKILIKEERERGEEEKPRMKRKVKGEDDESRGRK